MIRVILPAGAPVWAVGISLAGVVLIGLILGLARLTRAALPGTPAERVEWWKCYWRHRRALRRDRWRRHEQRRPGVTKRDPARRADSNPERRKGRRWYAAVEGRIGRLTTEYLYPHQTVMTEVSKLWSTSWRRQPENRPFTWKQGRWAGRAPPFRAIAPVPGHARIYHHPPRRHRRRRPRTPSRRQEHRLRPAR